MHKEGSSPKASEIAEELITSGGKIGLNILLPILGPIINEAFAVRSRLAHKREEKHDELVVKKLGKTLGPIINDAFDDHSHLSQKRKEKYLKLVITKLENIDESLIDKEFIQTEDFTDLIQTIMNKISLRHASEKTEFFANLSIASMVKTRPKDQTDWQIRFIEAIGELSKKEMALLKSFNDHPSTDDGQIDKAATRFGFDQIEFDLCLETLLSKRLVFDGSLSNKSIVISPLAKKVIHFISEIEGIVNRATHPKSL